MSSSVAGMNCAVCKSATQTLFTKLPDRLHPEVPGNYVLKKCPQCRLLLLDPQPSDAELDAHYPDSYHIYQQSIAKSSALKLFVTKIVARNYLGYGRQNPLLKIVLFSLYYKLSHLPDFKPNGKLLDVGCGSGTRLATFAALGWTADGLEMNVRTAQSVRDAGFRVFTQPVEKANLPENCYDVVYLNNVFEHLRDPGEALRKIRRALKPGARIILIVPNSNGLAFRLFKKHWFGLEVPRHLFTYNRTNLTQLLGQHGFLVKKIVCVNTLGSISSSLAYKFRKRADTFAFAEKIFWILNFFLDPLLNRFAIGDWIVVHAELRKTNAG